MAKYIDKSQMLKFLEENNTADEWIANQYNADWIYSFIESQPTADFEKPKNGCWEDIGERFVNCSNCGTIFEALPTMFAFKSNNIFCRHCGAKMDRTPKERGGDK